MENFEAFRWTFSSSTNSEIGRSALADGLGTIFRSVRNNPLDTETKVETTILVIVVE